MSTITSIFSEMLGNTYLGVPQVWLHYLRCEGQGPRLHWGDWKGNFNFKIFISSS